MRRRRPLVLVSLVLMLGVVAGSTAGLKPSRVSQDRPYFVGDFNTCDFSQWQGLQGPKASFKIVRMPRVEGRCAAAITVGPWALGGLVNSQADGATWYRREHPATYSSNGQSVWQHFSVRFRHGFRATPGEWNLFVEWHDDEGWQKYPEISFEYANLVWMIRTPPRIKRGARVGMRIMGGPSTSPRTVHVNGPFLRTGHWYDFLAHTVWSPDPNHGLVEWWLDGKLLYSRHVPTLYTRPDGTVSTVYFGEYNYRLHASWNSTIYFDGTRLGPTRSSVLYR
jgi:Polysaccharide lyase